MADDKGAHGAGGPFGFMAAQKFTAFQRHIARMRA
jgi:hypothetical protein